MGVGCIALGGDRLLQVIRDWGDSFALLCSCSYLGLLPVNPTSILSSTNVSVPCVMIGLLVLVGITLFVQFLTSSLEHAIGIGGLLGSRSVVAGVNDEQCCVL